VEKTDGTWTQETRDTIRLSQPIAILPTTTHSAEVAYQRVLDYAGCSLHRDWVDDMIIRDTSLGIAFNTGSKLDAKGRPNSPGIIDDPEDNRPPKADKDWNPWPELKSQPAPADTDGDGVPDDWEKEVGMNPNDPADGTTIHEPTGYTYLEVYLSTLVAPIMQAENAGGKVM
jgi:hypothetical protein